MASPHADRGSAVDPRALGRLVLARGARPGGMRVQKLPPLFPKVDE